jgi:hypothetical protein
MKKGGPRTALYDLCKKVQWPMPTFDTTETKSRLANSTSSLSCLFFPPNFHLYAKIKYFLSPLLIVQGILFSMLHFFCMFFSLSSNQLLSAELELNSVKAPKKERGLTVTYQKSS